MAPFRLEEVIDFQKVSKQIQSYHFHSIGKHDHRILEPCPEQESILQKCVAMALFDLPTEPESRENNYTGYNEEQMTLVKKIVGEIYFYNNRFQNLRVRKNEIHYGIIQIVGFTHDQKTYSRPLFKIFPSDRNDEDGVLYLDHEQMFENFEHFLEENTLPESLICYPSNGRYTWDRQENVPDLEYHHIERSVTRADTQVATRHQQYGISLFGNLFELLKTVIGAAWEYVKEGIKKFGIGLYEVGQKIYQFVDETYKKYPKLFLAAGIGLTALASFMFGRLAVNKLGVVYNAVLSSFSNLIARSSQSLIGSIDVTQFKAIFSYFCNANISTERLNDLLQSGFWTSLTSVHRLPALLGQQSATSQHMVSVNDNLTFLQLLGRSISQVNGIDIFHSILQEFKSMMNIIGEEEKPIGWSKMKEILMSVLTRQLPAILNQISRSINDFPMQNGSINDKIQLYVDQDHTNKYIQQMNDLCKVTNLDLNQNCVDESLDQKLTTLTQQLLKKLNRPQQNTIKDFVNLKLFIKSYLFYSTSQELSIKEFKNRDDQHFKQIINDVTNDIKFEINEFQDGSVIKRQLVKWESENRKDTPLILLYSENDVDLYYFDVRMFDIDKIANCLLNTAEYKVSRFGNNIYSVCSDSRSSFVTIIEQNREQLGIVFMYPVKKSVKLVSV